MSVIGKNIRKVRVLNNYTQAAFAALFGVNRSNISAYEDGRANPKNDLLLKICAHFSISVEKFSLKELTVNELSKFDDHIVAENQQALKNQTTIPFVSELKIKDYVKKQHKADIRFQLPSFSFPFSVLGVVQAFEVSAHGIDELSDKCILICNELSLHSLEGKSSKDLFVLILKESCKVGYLDFDVDERYLNAGSNERKTKILKEEVVEVWKVVGVLNMNVQFSSIYQNLQVLSKKISEMSKKIGE
jgi:transcriptional regulator with XRE-family HTH domain